MKPRDTSWPLGSCPLTYNIAGLPIYVSYIARYRIKFSAIFASFTSGLKAWHRVILRIFVFQRLQTSLWPTKSFNLSLMHLSVFSLFISDIFLREKASIFYLHYYKDVRKYPSHCLNLMKIRCLCLLRHKKSIGDA